MIKPYYDKDGIIIYNADNRDVLAEFEPGDVDLVLTDSPYGISYVSNHYKDGNPYGPIAGDDKFPIETVKLCIQLADSATLVFGRWSVLGEFPPPKSCIVWAKGGMSAGDLKHGYSSIWEMVAFYPGKHHAFRDGRPRDVIECPKVPASRMCHPTEKPVALLETLISHHVGNTVLDPFMGSGATLIAARNQGLVGIGIEIEERYCEVAVKRLEQKREE